MPNPEPSPDRPDPTGAPLVALTGAAGAIASSVAERFAAEGWRLALLDLPANEARLRERWPDAVVIGADLTDEADARRAVGEIRSQGGEIEALLNIAGGFGMQSALEAPLAALEKQLALNLKTLYLTTGAALPSMVERGRGHVVAVAAGPAKSGAARMPAYTAAKGAVASYLRSVRAEVASEGVWASLLWPMGTVDTPANRDAMPGTDPAGWIAREAIAEALHFLVTRGPRGRVPELELTVG